VKPSSRGAAYLQGKRSCGVRGQPVWPIIDAQVLLPGCKEHLPFGHQIAGRCIPGSILALYLQLPVTFITKTPSSAGENCLQTARRGPLRSAHALFPRRKWHLNIQIMHRACRRQDSPENIPPTDASVSSGEEVAKGPAKSALDCIINAQNLGCYEVTYCADNHWKYPLLDGCKMESSEHDFTDSHLY
jgi:hypothetical protein